jgi:hypothetical protein
VPVGGCGSIPVWLAEAENDGARVSRGRLDEVSAGVECCARAPEGAVVVVTAGVLCATRAGGRELRSVLGLTVSRLRADGLSRDDAGETVSDFDGATAVAGGETTASVSATVFEVPVDGVAGSAFGVGADAATATGSLGAF